MTDPKLVEALARLIAKAGELGMRSSEPDHWLDAAREFVDTHILRVIDEDVADLIAVSEGLDPTSEEWRQVQARFGTATRIRARFEEGDEKPGAVGWVV